MRSRPYLLAPWAVGEGSRVNQEPMGCTCSCRGPSPGSPELLSITWAVLSIRRAVARRRASQVSVPISKGPRGSGVSWSGWTPMVLPRNLTVMSREGGGGRGSTVQPGEGVGQNPGRPPQCTGCLTSNLASAAGTAGGQTLGRAGWPVTISSAALGDAPDPGAPSVAAWPWNPPTNRSIRPAPPSEASEACPWHPSKASCLLLYPGPHPYPGYNSWRATPQGSHLQGTQPHIPPRL